jgi:hypothetical protein
MGSAGYIVHSGASEARNVETQIFMLGLHRYGFHKNCNGTRYVELLFLHPVGSARHVVHSVRLRHETSMHYFSCSGGTSTDLTKSASGHVGPNFCFLHPEGSVGNIVHSDASWAQNVNTLFFMLGWDQYGFEKITTGHVTPNFCFCIQWDLRLT